MSKWFIEFWIHELILHLFMRWLKSLYLWILSLLPSIFKFIHIICWRFETMFWYHVYPRNVDLTNWMNWKWMMNLFLNITCDIFYESLSWFLDIWYMKFYNESRFFFNQSPKIFFWLFMRRFFKKKSCLLVYTYSNPSWYDFYAIACIHENIHLITQLILLDIPNVMNEIMHEIQMRS